MIPNTLISSLLPPQDENDNPPEFSLPSYIVNIAENIVAGTFTIILSKNGRIYQHVAHVQCSEPHDSITRFLSVMIYNVQPAVH